MKRGNEILSIQALLRSRMRDNLEASTALIKDYQALDEKLGEANKRADAALEEALALAQALGGDAEAMRAEHNSAMQAVLDAQAAEEHTPKELHITLPADFSFSEEFARLSREARAAGFDDVRIDDLLTEEEITRVIREEEDLDAQFARESNLKIKDIGVMMLAVAVRLILSLVKISEKAVSQEQEVIGATPLRPQVMEVGADAVDPSQLPETNVLRQAIERESEERARTQKESEDAENAVKIKERVIGALLDWGGKIRGGKKAAQQPMATTPAPMIDAGAGVDLSAVRSEANRPAVLSGVQPITPKRKKKKVIVRGSDSILNEPVPFDIPDNGYFSHKEIAGFDPFLGWVIGVINLMTQTVTTYRMQSYSVAKADRDGAKMRVDEELSTVMHVLIPVLRDGIDKDTICAAVVKEAAVLGVARSTPEEISLLCSRAIELEREQAQLADTAVKAGDLLKKTGIEVFEQLGSFAEAALVNTIIAAIHAIVYDPEKDGELNLYALRTQRILAYSSAIAAVAANVPAIAAKNIKLADFGSVVEACLRVLNYNQFWIDCKAEFLDSVYKKTIDAELARMEKYFSFEAGV